MKISIIAMFVAGFAVAGCQPSAPPTVQQVTSPSVTISSGGMMTLLNAARSAQGLGGVRENRRLSRASALHAQDMVAQGYFSHTGANGSRFTQRAQASGYGCAVAENIASGQTSETEVMQAWMNSSGHRRNILNTRATEYGIGRSGTMWVLMMGSGC